MCASLKIKAEFDPAVYDEQVSMMEMVLDVDDIVNEMTSIREQYCKYLSTDKPVGRRHGRRPASSVTAAFCVVGR